MYRKLSPRRIVLLVAATATLAAACGSGESAAPAAPAAPAPSAAGTDLTVAVWTGPEAEALRAVAAAFTTATGINLIIDEVARDAYRTRATTITLSRDPAWDAYWSDGLWLAEYVQAGGLTPLDDILADSIDEIGGLNYVEFDGSIYGLPTEFHSQYLWYRSDIFEELGVAVPQTWDEYAAAVAKLTDTSKGRYGGVIRTAGGGGALGIHFEFTNFFLGFGAKFLDENGRPAVNSPEGVAALQYFINLNNSGNVPPDGTAVGYLEKNQFVQRGDAATTIQWTAGFNTLTSCEQSPDICDVIDYSLIPGRLVNGQVVRGAMASLNAWVMPQGSSNPAGAAEFIRWMASEEGGKLWALNGGTPANKAALTDPGVLAVRPDYAVLAETLEFVTVFPFFPESPEMVSLWAENTALAVQGRLTAQQAMDNIAQQWEAILVEGGHL